MAQVAGYLAQSFSLSDMHRYHSEQGKEILSDPLGDDLSHPNVQYRDTAGRREKNGIFK